MDLLVLSSETIRKSGRLVHFTLEISEPRQRGPVPWVGDSCPNSAGHRHVCPQSVSVHVAHVSRRRLKGRKVKSESLRHVTHTRASTHAHGRGSQAAAVRPTRHRL